MSEWLRFPAEILTDEVQSLRDPGQKVVPQGVIDGNAQVSGVGEEGGLGAAATHTQHVGDTVRGQAVLWSEPKQTWKTM